MQLSPLEILEVLSCVFLGIIGTQLIIVLWRLNGILKEFRQTARYVHTVNQFFSFLDGSLFQKGSSALDTVRKFFS